MAQLRQVLLKRTNEHMGTRELIRVTVLSEKDGKMRVKFPGVYHPREIDAADTLPATTRAATPMFQTPGSLARDLY